ncbi:hypothetical protein HS088_TW13G00474 [Tripterygium wilfordii]|uniref:RRM domain-containing protein n=1 Tax=Tripterygium wilfordii TaxID=458696 RepID=A0A7J7CUF7_TRIWF|nr:UBP1-associated protein 2B-like [Tripterygium wilfordii]XP_038720926.1 UBP1-associated protein 2B-like [Tripterygium wilfordii]KAF5737589.1 hypothetical protein HS088_TW13G00474 [Tripterygium wilfordii]
MAKKRKHDSESIDPTAPPQKQQQQKLEPVAVKREPTTQNEQTPPQKQQQQQREPVYVKREPTTQNEQTAPQKQQQQKLEPVAVKLEPTTQNEQTPPQKQQQQNLEPVAVKLEPTTQNEQTVEEEYEEEYEEIEEEEEVEEEEENDHEDQNASNQTLQNASTSNLGAVEEGDDEDEPISKLLEPFSKEQLVMLLCEAADSHRDVADRILVVADEDHVHRKIFVHGLGRDTNGEILRSEFKQYGEIEDCKAVRDKISGKSKGYGFILFKSRRGAREALKQPQKKIGNRMTACQLASIGPVPAPGTAPAVQPQQQLLSEYTLRKIYVSNVGAELDPQKLLAFFSKFGEIEEGPLGLDKMTGKPKGFCLFVYKTVESAKMALEEPHKNFEGHILHCQKAIDGRKPGKGHPRQHHGQHNSQFQRNDNQGFVGGAAAGGGHLMAPAAGIGFNQGGAAPQAFNAALGQALTALLATQGAGLGLSNLLGTLGSAATGLQAVPSSATGLQAVYGTQTNISPGVVGGYGNQAGMQGPYPNQQIGQGGSGRGQHGVGQFGGVGPYMGH